MTAGRRFIGAALVLVSASVSSIDPASAAEPRDPTRFACPPDLDAPFDDIAATTHETSIECAVHYDLTGGTGPRAYSPNQAVTRGQMATFLVRLLGFGDVPPEAVPGAAEFEDTDGNAHEGSISVLVLFDIAQGTSPTTFSPNAPVTRAQMATFLDRVTVFVELPRGVVEDAFTDDDGSTHEDAINRMAALGIAGGTGPGTYAPNDAVTRGAMATFLVRFIDAAIEIGAYTPNDAEETLAALVPPDGESSARGYAQVRTTEVPGVLCGGAAVTGIDPDDVAAVQVREARTEEVVVDLPLVAPDAVVGCTSEPGAADLRDDPEGFVVEVLVRGEDEPVLSGPLGVLEAVALAEMEGDEVVPGPGLDTAFGISVAYFTSQPRTVCIGVLAEDDDSFEPIIGETHVHDGPRHANGPVGLSLGPASLDVPAPFECVVDDLADEFRADPEAFYVDIHTDEFPDGAVRGQYEPTDLLPFGSVAQTRGFRIG